MGKRTHPLVGRRPNRVPVVLLSVLLAVLLAAPSVRSEFFRYVDKEGNVHYVDDIGRIPPEYREDLKSYTDRYDGLSEPDRSRLREAEQQKSEQGRREMLNLIEEAEKRRIEREERSKNPVTEVVIKGNQVLLPVRIGYGKKEMTAMLVLDTGAEVTVLHADVAEKLNIRTAQKGTVSVAGGQKVPVGVVHLAYLQAGPHTKTDILAVVISPEGPLQYQGLLGMNFLKDLDYTIDFTRSHIRWRR